MDKEQARFILQSFRPDGADARDPDFAEALAVVAGNRELGDWLAGERAQDASFAAALSAVEIPEELRENILQVLRGEQPAEQDFNALDATMIGALAGIRPPEGLRDQIVNAMMVEGGPASGQASVASPKAAPKRVQSWLKSAAVAAAIVLGAFVAFELTPRTKAPAVVKDDAASPVIQRGTLTLSSLEREFIGTVARGPQLDLQESDFQKNLQFLEAHEGPLASAKDLPRGLEGLKGLGCQLLKVGKTKASLLCFDRDGQTVHLVVVRREDLANSEILEGPEAVKVDSDTCHQCPVTKVSVARWADDHNAFFLLGQIDPDELVKYF